MSNRTSNITDIIDEAVDQALRYLVELGILPNEKGEYEGELELGIMELKLDQREVKQRFLAVARSVPYDLMAEQEFIQQFGQEAWDRQHTLDMRQE